MKPLDLRELEALSEEYSIDTIRETHSQRLDGEGEAYLEGLAREDRETEIHLKYLGERFRSEAPPAPVFSKPTSAPHWLKRKTPIPNALLLVAAALVLVTLGPFLVPDAGPPIAEDVLVTRSLERLQTSSEATDQLVQLWTDAGKTLLTLGQRENSDELLTAALAEFEKAHQLAPDDRLVLWYLVEVCTHLDLREKRAHYDSILSSTR